MKSNRPSKEITKEIVTGRREIVVRDGKQWVRNVDGSYSTTIAIRCDEPMYVRLDTIAQKDRRAIAAIIKILIEDGLPAYEKKMGITSPAKNDGK